MTATEEPVPAAAVDAAAAAAVAKTKTRSEIARRGRAKRETARRRRDFLLHKQQITYELRQLSADRGTESFSHLQSSVTDSWGWPQADGELEQEERPSFLSVIDQQPLPMPEKHSRVEAYLNVEDCGAAPALSLAAHLLPEDTGPLDQVRIQLPLWVTDGSVSSGELENILKTVMEGLLDPSKGQAGAPDRINAEDRQKLQAMLPKDLQETMTEMADIQRFGASQLGRFADGLASGRYMEHNVWQRLDANHVQEEAVRRYRCEFKQNLLRRIAHHKHELGFDDQEQPYRYHLLPPSSSVARSGIEDDIEVECDGELQFFPDGSRKARGGRFGAYRFSDVDGKEVSIDVDEVSERLEVELQEIAGEVNARQQGATGKRRGARVAVDEEEEFALKKSRDQKRAEARAAKKELGKKRKREEVTPTKAPVIDYEEEARQKRKNATAALLSAYKLQAEKAGLSAVPTSLAAATNDMEDVEVVPPGPTWVFFSSLREAFVTAGGPTRELTLFDVMTEMAKNEDAQSFTWGAIPLENMVLMALDFLAHPPAFPMPSTEDVNLKGGRRPRKAMTPKKEEKAAVEEKVAVVEFSMPSAAPKPIMRALAASPEAAEVTKVETPVPASPGTPKKRAKKVEKESHGMVFVEYGEAKEIFKWKEAEETKERKRVLVVLEMLFYFAITRGEYNAERSVINLKATKQRRSCATVVESFATERRSYQEQEERRYQIPARPYCYNYMGVECVVAPIRRKITAFGKAREHPVLRSDRPAHISMLSLVRDAASRLPGGVGTRPDVANLLKDSQYLVDNPSAAKLNQIVSGALDRLHVEEDACVRYYSDQLLWVYLHRRRKTNNFEPFVPK